VILFIDASAIVAMITQEDDARILADRLDGASRLLWSPIVQWESAVALKRIRKYESPYSARGDIYTFSKIYGLDSVTIGKHESELAFDAFALFGKGMHPARLNMGDCFAYACAKSSQARLLYKGKDFDLTDLAWHDA
jgi:ribonuclease VapC